jgi:hypothetical protein
MKTNIYTHYVRTLNLYSLNPTIWEWLKLLIYIREGPGSNVVSETGYPHSLIISSFDAV